jgi:hypothetical protein
LPQQFRFEETLAKLDEIDIWLQGHGYKAHDRIRKYSKNIREMLEFQVSDDLRLLESISDEKRREILWSYVEADEFVRAVEPLRRCIGDDVLAGPIDKALGGPADLYLENQKNSQGRNFMFELIMGGRLAKAGITPAFDQGPDLQVHFMGLRVAMQCKRPFSRAGLEETIGKAISQLKIDHADLSLIAISVSRLWNAGDPDEIPTVESPQAGQAYVDASGRAIADESRRFWSGKLQRAGILFYSFTPVRWLKEDGHFGHATLRAETMCPVMTGDQDTKAMLVNLISAMSA